jgi:hypothetical protein
MKKPKIIKETFTMDPERGAAAALIGLSKPGYRMIKMDRKRSKCVITYEKT